MVTTKDKFTNPAASENQNEAENHIVIHYADDDADDLEYFKDAVSLIGKKITLFTYQNSSKFLEKVRANKLQEGIVFLDLNMPGKTGFDILKEMRQADDLKELPVVVYSTSNNPNSIDVSMLLGANLYAVKPNNFPAVKSLIEKIIDINWSQFKPAKENFLIN